MVHRYFFNFLGITRSPHHLNVSDAMQTLPIFGCLILLTKLHRI